MSGPQQPTAESASSSSYLTTNSSSAGISASFPPPPQRQSPFPPPPSPPRQSPSPPLSQAQQKKKLFNSVANIIFGTRNLKAFFLRNVGFSHVLMAVACIATIFLSLALAGCTASGPVKDLHVISFTSRSAPLADSLVMNKTIVNAMHDLQQADPDSGVSRVLETRAGYFALCARLDPGGWRCGLHSDDKGDAFDPLGLVDMAHHYRTKTITPGLIILCIILNLVFIAILYTYPGWHEEEDSLGSVREVKPFPSRIATQGACICVFMSGICLYVAVAWHHISVAAIAASVQGLRYGLVQVDTGVAAVALAWTGVFLVLLCFAGMTLTIVSAKLLDALA